MEQKRKDSIPVGGGVISEDIISVPVIQNKPKESS